MCNPLNMGETRQRVGVEGEGRTGEQRRGAVAGPREHQRVAGERGQREASQHQQVEHKHRRAAKQTDRRAEQRRNDQRLGKRECVVGGIEDVRLEELAPGACEGVLAPTARIHSFSCASPLSFRDKTAGEVASGHVCTIASATQRSAGNVHSRRCITARPCF